MKFNIRERGDGTQFHACGQIRLYRCPSYFLGGISYK